VHDIIASLLGYVIVDISTGGLGDYRTNSHPGGRRILPTHIAAIQPCQSWPID
jgi:hypothetical protein